MPSLTLTFRLTPGVLPTKQRAVGFLEGHSELDAGIEFDSWGSVKAGKRLAHVMGLWILDPKDRAGKFHRFKSDRDHPNTIVFEDIPEAIRLYGFTCHPLRKTNPAFELAVLCISAKKKKNLTDKAELDRVEQWRTNLATWNALKLVYPDVSEPNNDGRN